MMVTAMAAMIGTAKAATKTEVDEAKRAMRERRFAVRNPWAIVRFESLLLRPPREALTAVASALGLGDAFIEHFPFGSIQWSNRPAPASRVKLS